MAASRQSDSQHSGVAEVESSHSAVRLTLSDCTLLENNAEPGGNVANDRVDYVLHQLSTFDHNSLAGLEGPGICQADSGAKPSSWADNAEGDARSDLSGWTV